MKKTILLTMIAFTALVLTNCESNENDTLISTSQNYSDSPYLTLFIPQNRNEEIEYARIMEEANKRVAPYLKVVNNRMELTLKSGAEINVSEEIFNMFVEGTRINNQLIEEGRAYIHNGKIYEYTPFSNRIPRIKRSTPEVGNTDKPYSTEIERLPNGGFKETITCKDENAALAYYEDHKEAGKPLGALLYYASKGLDETIGGPIAQLFSYACDIITWKTDSMEEALYNAARDGGLTIVTTYDPRPQFPGGATQSTTILYDKKGNEIGIF